jgi:hypothetical protein
MKLTTIKVKIQTSELYNNTSFRTLILIYILFQDIDFRKVIGVQN